MLGILFGAACLVGLIKVARGGWGRGYGRWGHGGYGPGRGRFGGRGRWMMRGLFERLETTPGQEKVILEAVDEVRTAAANIRGDAEGARHDVAEALRGEHFDQEKVREVFTRFDTKTEDVKKAVMAGLSKIHEALDEGQRKELASILESFGRFGRCGGRGAMYASV